MDRFFIFALGLAIGSGGLYLATRNQVADLQKEVKQLEEVAVILKAYNHRYPMGRWER